MQHHDILRLDIPMDDPLAVQVFQDVNQHQRHGHRCPYTHSNLHQIPQRGPVTELHGIEHGTPLGTPVMNPDHVGMVHPFPDDAFPFKSLSPVFIHGIRIQHLQGNK